MKKRFVSIILALVMILSLCACGNANGAPSAEPTAAEEPTEEAAPAVQPAEPELSDTDKQLALIYSQLDKLQQQSADLPWYYTVTDLDHDGCLEFIAAAQHPADRSTNLKIWEVTADRTALSECLVSKDPEESFPDIMTDSMDTFHDLKTDTWYYLFYDNVVISANDVYTSKSAFNMKDGVISYEAYAVEHSLVEGGVRKVSHTDTTGLDITADEFNAAGLKAFEGTERSNTSFEWLTAEDAKDLHRLTDSYAVFMGLRKATEKLPVPQPAALQVPEAAATPAPTATPQPTPAPTPAPTPKPEEPKIMFITKHPTNELDRKTGGTANFVACANVFESLTWTIVAPDHGEYSISSFMTNYPEITVEGYYTTTLSLKNLTTEMNNWGAYCTFTYKGQVQRTSTAYIYMRDVPPTPDPSTETGFFEGHVEDYDFSTITINCEGIDMFTVNLNICDIDGELYIGAPAKVYWTGRNARGVDKVTSVYVQGGHHEVGPVLGALTGKAYRDTAFTEYLVFDDGSTATVPVEVWIRP